MRCERSIGGACVSSSRSWPCREAQGKYRGDEGSIACSKQPASRTLRTDEVERQFVWLRLIARATMKAAVNHKALESRSTCPPAILRERTRNRCERWDAFPGSFYFRARAARACSSETLCTLLIITHPQSRSTTTLNFPRAAAIPPCAG